MKRQIYHILAALGIGKGTVKIYKNISHFFSMHYNARFNPIVAAQNKDYRSIPIVIISFNQLDYLQRLVDFLQQNHYSNIVIIDNHSTYQPLLHYFNTIESTVTIHRLSENYGHLVFWKNREMFERYSKGYYVITDADINPIAQCPADFLQLFKKLLDKSPLVTKVGFSLKIDDIPETNVNKETVLKWESAFWKNTDRDGNFLADLDTTFAIYRPHYDRKVDGFLKAIRTKYPYQAKHGGWYIDLNKLSEEEQFYLDTCNASSSWRTDDKGNLKTHVYK
jgi:hypothetical protein